MHVSEGVLSGPVLLTGMVIGAAGVAAGLRKLDYDHIPRAGLLSSAFFVASLVHVPIGPAHAHLVLNGIVGLLMGWGAFPVILIALALQAVFFQFGGISTLGVNTVIMAVPAVLCYHLFGPLVRRGRIVSVCAGCAIGFLSVALSGVLLASALLCTDEDFLKTSFVVLGAHVPLMIIEGLITGLCVGFLRKVEPSMLPFNRASATIAHRQAAAPGGPGA